MVLLRLASVLLVFLMLLCSAPEPAQSLKDDDFAEFEDDDEFDFEVSSEGEGEEDCKYLASQHYNSNAIGLYPM